MPEIAQPVQIPAERQPGTMHSFFALKFHDGDEDREKVEKIEAALNQAGITITLMARDVEKWGKAVLPEGKKTHARLRLSCYASMRLQHYRI